MFLQSFNGFDTYTDYVNYIINQDANKMLTDKEVLELEIQDWLLSKNRLEQIKGEEYYQGKHDILKKKRKIYGVDEEVKELEKLPNTKLIDNQYRKLVDQKINYLLSKPFSVECKNKEFTEILQSYFNPNFQRLLQGLLQDCINQGIGWLIAYVNEKGELRFKKFESYQVLADWLDSEHTELNFIVRRYVEEYYTASKSKQIMDYVEIYSKDGIDRYVYENGVLVPDILHGEHSNYLIVKDGEDTQEYNFEYLPVIPFKFNAEEIPLIRNIKSLQDAINDINSNFMDSQLVDTYNSIIVIKNYDGTDLAEFREKLSKYGAVKISGDGDVSTLKVEVNSENYKSVLGVLKRALIENAQGYDINELKSNGQANEMTIMSVYSDINLSCDAIEIEFKASFDILIQIIKDYLYNFKGLDFRNEVVTIKFNRNSIINASDIITNLKNSVGMISMKTILSNHPYVKDVNEELKQLELEKKEQLESLDLYSNGFNHLHEEDGDLDATE